MLIPELYEFEHAVRFNGKPGVTCIRASECDVHFDDHWLIFVGANGEATQVPRENIHYIYGRWVTAQISPAKRPRK